jgi:hypothetical protein
MLSGTIKVLTEPPVPAINSECYTWSTHTYHFT